MLLVVTGVLIKTEADRWMAQHSCLFDSLTGLSLVSTPPRSLIQEDGGWGVGGKRGGGGGGLPMSVSGVDDVNLSFNLI